MPYAYISDILHVFYCFDLILMYTYIETNMSLYILMLTGLFNTYHEQ